MSVLGDIFSRPSPCRLQPATISPAGFSATPRGKSIRKLLKLGKRSTSACMSVRRPAELGLPHHTHTRACKQLWQEQAERHGSTAANAHFLTHTHTHSFYCSHWDHLCWCCVLQDLSLSLSAWVSFFPFFFSLLLSSLLPGGHHRSALPSVHHAEEHDAPSGCRRFHTVAKTVNWNFKKKRKRKKHLLTTS